MATLYVLQGRDKGKRHDLVGLPITLGRDRSNRLQLADSEVSRRHAEVRLDDAGFVLVDLGSSNGSFVNAERVNGERRLANGDRVQIGRSLLLFTDADQPSEPSLAQEVAIVAAAAGENSRIVKAVSPDSGSQIFAAEEADSPWLVAARSNLQFMYRTALAVSRTLDIDQLLVRLLDLIFEWVEADRGCILLVDSETNELTPTVSRSRDGTQGGERMTISRTILDYVMERKEGVLTSDAKGDARWNADGSIVMLGVREAICVPMQGRYGIVGGIYIDTYTAPGKLLPTYSANKFSEEHLRLMVAIGHQAALAVEDTSYYSAMVQAERLAAMGQTIATLSHHIKNILQGIRGGSFLIEEGLKASDYDVVRRGWRIVERNQDRISALVMDMLTFSKDRQPDLVAANLNETLEDVVELMKSRATEANVELAWQARSDLPTFLFDSELLHRAVLNVVTNAIDACAKRPGAKVELAVEWAAGDQFVQIVVADNGEGIVPEDLQRIFSVFESRKGSRGTGLGLPVSQKIMREHGGEIRVESTPGMGSRFYLELPAQNATALRGTTTEAFKTLRPAP